MSESKYKIVVTDVMGTTTPKSHVEELKQHLLSIKEEIADKKGVTIDDIVESAETGLAEGMKGNKDHPAFRKFLGYSDLASQLGYERGNLTLSLFDDAREALLKINEQGYKIRIYSSGDIKTSENGMKTQGLNHIVQKYHSSSQKETKSKFAPESYKAIAKDSGVDVKEAAYVTDDAAEAEAAVKAGYGKVFLISRKANLDDLGTKNGYIVINDYKVVPELLKE